MRALFLLILFFPGALASAQDETAIVRELPMQSIPQIGAEVRDLGLPKSLPPTEAPQPPLGPARPLTLAQAVALTLAQNPNIQLARESVLLAQGQLRQAAGPFDPTLTANSSISVQDDTISQTSQNLLLSELLGYQLNSTSTQPLREESINARMQLAKTFRSGITVASRAVVSGVDQEQSSANANQGQGMVGFTVQIPLLRGLGPNSTNTATERAARYQLQASEQSEIFTVSQQVLQTINAYWNLLLAQESVRIARSNESAALRLLEITEALIQGYIQPQFSLIQSRANYEQYLAQRITAEQQQSQASQQLAVSLGLTPQEVLLEPLVIEDFPEPTKIGAFGSFGASDIPRLIQLALRERPDLRAARLTQQMNVALLEGAKNNALPAVDITLGAAGLSSQATNGPSNSSNSSAASVQNQTGLGVTGGISMEFPFFNDAAQGVVMQQQAQLSQAEWQVTMQENQIASMVVASAKAVLNAARALEASEAAVRDQLRSVEGQEKLFAMGMSSLVEVITTQTNLASAELALLQSKSNYANAIAQVRYATGTLVPPRREEAFELTIKSLLHLPGDAP